MKKVFLVFSFVLIIIFFCNGQHLIGIEKTAMAGVVKKEMRGFNLDNASVNKSFNYLKFINSAGTKTLIVFFNDKNISTNTRLVCDFSESDFVLEDLKKKYKKIGENRWEYSLGRNKYEVTIENKEWYFVVNTKKKVVKKAGLKRFFNWKL